MKYIRFAGAIVAALFTVTMFIGMIQTFFLKLNIHNPRMDTWIDKLLLIIAYSSIATFCALASIHLFGRLKQNKKMGVIGLGSLILFFILFLYRYGFGGPW